MNTKTGRPRCKINEEDFARYNEEKKNKRITSAEAARQLNISRRTYYRRLKESRETET